MKHFTYTALLILLSTISEAQIIKSFNVTHFENDSISNCSLKVKFDSLLNEDERLELTIAKIDENYFVISDKIISIEEFIDKRFLQFRYRIKFKGRGTTNED